MRFLVCILCMLLIAFMAPAAYARPISYPGGWTLMQKNDFDSNELHVHYTVTPRYSIGPEFDLFREEGSLKMVTLQNTFLLKRWNGHDSQGNIYIKGGPGIAQNDNAERFAVRGGMMADWEDRRFLVAYSNTLTYANDLKEDYTQMFRVGVAPYVAEYGSLHTWLMLQVDHQPESRDEIVVTPLVRLFKGTALVEAGVSSNRNLLFNWTYQF